MSNLPRLTADYEQKYHRRSLQHITVGGVDWENGLENRTIDGNGYIKRSATLFSERQEINDMNIHQ